MYQGDPPPARAPLIPALENSQRVHALSYPGIKPEPIEPHIRNMSPPSSVTKRSTTPVSFIDPFAGYATHQDRALAVEGAVRMLQSPAPFIKPDPALPSPSLTNAPRLENQIRNHQMPHAGVFSPPKLPAVSHIKPEPRQTPEWNMSNFPRSASMSDVPQSPFVGPQYSREASDKSKITDIIKDAFDESNDLSTSPIQLQTLFKDVPVEIMERGIKRGLDLLDKITTSMSTAENEETKAWMAQIDKIRKQAEVQRTVIGVVGNTGAGKSSVINALLDEERLVPTNCMRACTAVVTEISYNSETDHAYRASIEFISESDWLKELKGLYQDLFDEYGDMKNVSRDADAAVAWAKIKAVYPKKIKEQITETTPERLVREGPVQSVLGKSIPIKESDSMRFYKKLQRYVDSQEKAKKDDKKPREMEFWPLIRVVKIFVKSPTLETGAVVVDLP